MNIVGNNPVKHTIVIDRFDEGGTDEREHIVSEGCALTVVCIAGQINRHIQCRVRLIGVGARAIILGFVTGSGDNECSFSTYQIHEAPNTTSNLLVKSVLMDESSFRYTGSIHVHPIAQKTDAYQRNENLILSAGANVESQPILEILANDVRCTHGVATSTIDKEQLWYLCSRAISETSARSLIIEGFFESTLSHIPDIILREAVRKSIWQSL